MATTGTCALFDLSSGLGYFLEEPPSIIAEAAQVFECSRHTKYLLLRQIHSLQWPASQRFQVQPPDWQATIAFYQLKPEYFNLTFPNEAVRSLWGEWHFLDPTDTMKNTILRIGKVYISPMEICTGTKRVITCLPAFFLNRSSKCMKIKRFRS